MAQRKGILRPHFRHIRGTDNRLIFGSSYRGGNLPPRILICMTFSPAKQHSPHLQRAPKYAILIWKFSKTTFYKVVLFFTFGMQPPGAIAQNIRIDTHADNKTMQHLIEADGFTRCGIIYIADGTPRIAYQWTAE